MSTDVKTEQDASVTTLVSGIISDVQDLLKQQFDLLKYEVREDMRKTKDATAAIGLGFAFGLVAAVLFGLMFAHFLAWAEPTIPLWVCYGISGAVLLVLGVVLYAVGLAKFNSIHPLKDETAQTLQENLRRISNPR
jgi:hypothetical protein